MFEGFGARLRQRREEQGIALGTIAERTKIKLSLLEALERDDVSHWPSGIFRRAYIRSYAQAIGLNPSEVAGEFLDAHPDPGEVVTTDTVAAAVEGTRPSAAPPTRLRYILGSALESLSRLRRPSAAAPGAGPAGMRPCDEPDLPLGSPQPDPWQEEQATGGMAESDPADVSLSSVADPEPATPPDREREHAGRSDLREAAAATLVHEPPAEPDLTAVAALCTELGRVENTTGVQRALRDAARILDAPGVIIWVWDGSADGLRAAMAHGYPDAVLAQLPVVRRDADNATAAAFRSARPCGIGGGPDTRGALVVPLLTAEGCAGVLAIELQHLRVQMPSVRAVATILAAFFAQLVGCPRSGEASSAADVAAPAG